MTDLTLSKKVFETGMLKLESAFMKKPLSKETLAIYYARLQLSSDKEFNKAVDGALDNEPWFPSIAALRKYLPSMNYAGMQ